MTNDFDKVKHYYLRFDNRPSKGSREHYFIFLWGYLLPCLHFMNRMSSKESVFHLMSCGPVMNEKIQELLSIFNFKYSLGEKPDSEKYKLIIVERWDIMLVYSASDNFDWIKTLSYLIREKRWMPRERQRIVMTIDYVLQALRPIINKEEDGLKNRYLILERSEEPEYYNKEKGQAEIPKYGKTRRTLLRIDETIIALKKQIPISKFEPGRFSILKQISVFHNAKGVIGVRGAEFANIAWMKPGSFVFMINSFNRMNSSPAKSLAYYRRLDFKELITSRNTNKPELYPTDILNALKN